MGFIKLLTGLPLFVIIAVFAFVNNDLATFNLWPFYIEITVSLSVAIIFFILIGFLWGKFFSWLSYAPVRKALRQQKKQNKKLNKEQQKLVKEVENLHGDLETLKERAPKPQKLSLKDKVKKFFNKQPAQEDDAGYRPVAKS